MGERVELRDITDANRDAVRALKLDPEQEELVASNEESLDEAEHDPGARPRAIYAGDRLVGFIMYDAGEPDDDPREAQIYRFMIDQSAQGSGYGRAALLATIEEIRGIGGIAKIEIGYMPENPVTKVFYESVGFVEVGLDEDGEMVAELSL
ncbi:spermine/spermidine acetyltransferase [Variibacter gotjawalensis]|uniref:Spermine/spermidine acetyltransferase n=1 Tax=Variibacter gotjawalensis TaxID=1333996 RepID=A0A0S3PTY3_9BRAD|nr:GNAT family N-acetyltransferase [Variibacter gotjawalensis]NIK49649.1 diamine N-acetyltransferase [Variibacter gotjawalensis]RZS45661.1 diamine N-acetyltransferase [Variibacter gotjawalensis]BAT59332.1 spermine/spermidine acetyltransferase [Variibacter gotjawalensis]